MAISVDLAKVLDKDYEDKSLKDILDASPAALARVTRCGCRGSAQAVNIKTVRQPGTNRFFAVAAVLAALDDSAALRDHRSRGRVVA